MFEGCGQRFSNNDHLAVHRQKHEFSLKFGVTSKAGEALLVDQTPTPTRFLRNCEESGLFQELAENPFEQEFEKSKNDPSKSHHPDHTSVSTSTSTHLSIASIPMAPPPGVANPDRPVPMATPPAHMNTTSAVTKQKLLQNIQMKEQQRVIEAQLVQLSNVNMTSPEILNALKAMQDGVSKEGATATVFAAPSGVPDHIANSLSAGRKRRGRKPDEEEPEIKRQKFLERNRAAASRCRAKKKLWVEDMEKKTKDMDALNQALQQEVVSLRSEVQQLKSILIAHKDCPLIVHQTVGGTPAKGDRDGISDGGSSGTEVTLLSQLAAMPSMSPLISSPVPSVGSVVPNISLASRSFSSTLPPSHTIPAHAAIIYTSNGAMHMTPEVAKDVEIGADEVVEQ
jgi:cyclic AMP-dependent transcription factor ATF-2